MMKKRKEEILPGSGMAKRGKTSWMQVLLVVVGIAVVLYVIATIGVLMRDPGDEKAAANAKELQRQAEKLPCPRGVMHVTYEETADDFRVADPAWDWKGVRRVAGPVSSSGAARLLGEVEMLELPVVLGMPEGPVASREMERLVEMFSGSLEWDEFEGDWEYRQGETEAAFFLPAENLLHHSDPEKAMLMTTWSHSQPHSRINPWRDTGGKEMAEVPLGMLLAYLEMPAGNRPKRQLEDRIVDAAYCFSTDFLFLYPAVPYLAISPGRLLGSPFYSAVVDGAVPYLDWLMGGHDVWSGVWQTPIRFGAVGSTTRMHWDEPSLGVNAIFTISGIKRVVLLPPIGFEKQFSGVDFFQPLTPQFDRNPSHPTRYMEPYFAEVRAGEVLLVPPGWLHAVYHPVDTISVSAFTHEAGNWI